MEGGQGQGRHRLRRTVGTRTGKRLSVGGLLALLVASVLPVGSVHWGVICAICAACCLGGLLASRILRPDWNPVATTCAVLALWTVCSLVPLPFFVASFLAPNNAELWQRALSPLNTAPVAWMPLSLDPIASGLETAKWCFYAVTSVLAAYVGRTRGLVWVMTCVWSSAVLVAVVTMFQAASGIQTVLGIYEPVGVSNRVTPSLLINPNNLAGYCNLGVFCGLGLIVSQRRLLPRPSIIAGTVICAATTFFSASRGGVAVLMIGALALGARYALRSFNVDGWGSPARRLSRWVPTLIVLMATGMVVLLGSTSAMWRELLDDDASKLTETTHLLPAIGRHFWVGVGRGAFETVSFLYFEDSHAVVRRSVENFVTSWAIEWGVPVSLAALAAFTWILRPSRMRLKGRRTAQAAYAGLLALVAQNLLDLGLEVLSVTAGAFVLLGGLEGSRARRVNGSPTSAPTASPDPSLRDRAVRLVPALGLIAASVSAFLGPSVFELRPAVAATVDRLIDEGAPMSEVESRLASEMAARPAESYWPLLGARAALELDKNALPWAAAAVSRAPHSGRSHFMLGEALLQRGALAQGLMELRIASMKDPQLELLAGKKVAETTKDIQKIVQATPMEGGGPFLLAVLRHLDRQEDQWLRRRLLLLAHERSPQDERVQSQLGFALLDDVRRGDEPCSSGRCPLIDPQLVSGRIHELAQDLIRNPKDPICSGLRLEAQLLALEERAGDALSLLRRCNQCAVPQPCARDRVGIAFRAGNTTERKQAETSFMALSCTNPESCARAEKLIGDLAARRNDWLSAYAHYLRAAGRDGTRQNWLATTLAALKAGRLVQAEVAYDQAQRLGGRDTSIDDLFVQARRASLRER